MHHPVRVLFVCVGNSCRSQMAEGFARHKYGDLIEPASAGLFPAATVQPETISCMAEKGVSLEGHTPKPLPSVDWQSMDLVVNMSGTAVLSFMPGFTGGNLVWNVNDPIGKPLKSYRRVRDQIEQLVDGLAGMLRQQQR